MKKGGLARRAGYLTQARTDSTLNLTVDVGNFAPPSHARADSVKTRTLVDFYRKYNYDAIGLSSREMQFGLPEWKQVAAEGVPILAANIFTDAGRRKPLFEQYRIKKEQGARLGVIGFVSATAWAARADTADTSQRLYFVSPFEQRKLVEKLARKCDHLTITGEFSPTEADSLAKVYPQVDLILSSGLRSGERPKEVGNAVILGVQNRGYVANYLEWNLAATDSTARYRAASATLDPSVPEDSTMARALNLAKEEMVRPR